MFRRSLPTNPVSALVVFEVMVRPLIRLSLGKRHPMRRVIKARAIAPIASVAGRTGFLRGQLLRDQDTGEYLVEAIGEAHGSSHLLALSPRPTAWWWCPAILRKLPPASWSTSHSWRGAADGAAKGSGMRVGDRLSVNLWGTAPHIRVGPTR